MSPNHSSMHYPNPNRKMPSNRKQPNQIEFFLELFDICGFNSGSSNLFQTRKSIRIITLIHCLLAILFTINQYFYFKFYYSYFKSFEIISELVECSASLCTYYLIIFDAIPYREAHKYFWNILQQIDECFCRQRHLIFQSYKIKLVIFLILIFLLILRYVLFDFVDNLIILVYMFLVKICQMRVLYYLFCLEVINFQLKNIEREIMQRCSSFEMQKFKWIRSYLYLIYQMVNILNEIFGWSQVAAILISFHCLFTDLNYFYIHFHELLWDEICGMKYSLFKICVQLSLFPNEHFVGGTIWIVHSLLLIFYLFLGVTSCSSTVNLKLNIYRSLISNS